MIRAASSLSATSAQQILFVLRSGNFQSVADQQFAKMFAGTNYLITSIVAVRKTGGASVACMGGIYSAAAKSGTVLVAATQSFLALDANVNVVPTRSAASEIALCTTTPFLSLTTGSTAAITADVFITGYIID